MNSLAPIYGLVLTGGKSTRMGTDKAQIEYHGKAHYLYLADLLSQCCDKTCISVSSTINSDLNTDFELVEDSVSLKGPIAGILSAMSKYPQAAWMVIACDLPLVNAATIEKLINERDTAKIATAFYNPETDFPEPLITLWEPSSKAAINEWIEKGFTCPRKVLINSDINLIQANDPKELLNANDPEVRKQVEDVLSLGTRTFKN